MADKGNEAQSSDKKVKRASELYSRYVRQQKVYQMACAGIPPVEIARRMGISRQLVHKDLQAAGIAIQDIIEEMPEEHRLALMNSLFNLDATVKDQIHWLEGLRHNLNNFIFVPLPDGSVRLNDTALDALLKISGQLFQYAQMYGNLTGKIQQPPSLTQINNNQFTVESNPEVDFLRQIYAESQATDKLIIDIEAAEAEGAALHEANEDASNSEGEANPGGA